MMVNVMDFSIKILELSITNNIHLFKGRWRNGISMSTMLGNGTLEGILEQLRMKWDILGSNVLASNESKHPWMDEGFTPMFQI
jgi:hypothetical protein